MLVVELEGPEGPVIVARRNVDELVVGECLSGDCGNIARAKREQEQRANDIA